MSRLVCHLPSFSGWIACTINFRKAWRKILSLLEAESFFSEVLSPSWVSCTLYVSQTWREGNGIHRILLRNSSHIRRWLRIRFPSPSIWPFELTMIITTIRSRQDSSVKWVEMRNREADWRDTWTLDTNQGKRKEVYTFTTIFSPGNVRYL